MMHRLLAERMPVEADAITNICHERVSAGQIECGPPRFVVLLLLDWWFGLLILPGIIAVKNWISQHRHRSGSLLASGRFSSQPARTEAEASNNLMLPINGSPLALPAVAETQRNVLLKTSGNDEQSFSLHCSPNRPKIIRLIRHPPVLLSRADAVFAYDRFFAPYTSVLIPAQQAAAVLNDWPFGSS